MEINRVLKTSISNKMSSKEKVAKDSISFHSVMDKNRNEQALELFQSKIKEIEQQGEKLVDQRTVESFRKYKRLVKDFMDYAVKNGLELQEHFGFSQRGMSKIYKLVKEVDSKLIDITNAVLDKESKSLDILKMVGEIKGLLINIYT